MRKASQAFTLVELLAAVTLGFAVIAAAYAGLSASIDSSRRIDGFVEESSTLANLTGTMRGQLTNVYFDQASELAPVFTVTPSTETSGTATSDAPKDTLTLSFAWRSTLADADPQYPYYTVTYFIADASSDSPGGLSRRISPLWPRDVSDTPEDELIAPEVRGLGAECFDGTVWTSEWDAASKGLPRAVRLDLYVEGERFAKDPWRVSDAASAPQGRLTVYRVFVSLAGTTKPAAAGETSAAPAGGAPNAQGQ